MCRNATPSADRTVSLIHSGARLRRTAADERFFDIRGINDRKAIPAAGWCADLWSARCWLREQFQHQQLDGYHLEQRGGRVEVNALDVHREHYAKHPRQLR
jgi:hypothetical protein